VFKTWKNNFVDGNSTDVTAGTVLTPVTPLKKAKKHHHAASRR
jgi:hypothetical protein